MIRDGSSIDENIIRRARKETGLTQKQLGERLGVTQEVVRQIELRNTNLTLESIKRIASALDVSVIELLLPALSESEKGILHQAFDRGYQAGYKAAKSEVFARMKTWFCGKEDDPDGKDKDHEKTPG